MRAFASMSRASEFWLAYDGAYLVLWAGRKFGFGSDLALGLVGAPIFVSWLVGSVRWVVTGSPVPRRSLRS